MLNNQKEKRRKVKAIIRHSVLNQFAMLVTFSFYLNLEQFIRPLEPVFRIEKIK